MEKRFFLGYNDRVRHLLASRTRFLFSDGSIGTALTALPDNPPYSSHEILGALYIRRGYPSFRHVYLRHNYNYNFG